KITVVSAVLLSCSAFTQNIEIVFSNLRSVSGQIRMQVYVDSKSFDEDKPLKVYKFPKKDIVQGIMVSKLNLEPGTYGFALVDDENLNNEMDFNILSIPKEGFGFSNFYLSGMKRPKFENFKFTIEKNQKLRINMKVRYM
ncbi:MAG: DUF2141 domain-containing protein, partial [Bacteroidia bacterium]